MVREISDTSSTSSSQLSKMTTPTYRVGKTIFSSSTSSSVESLPTFSVADRNQIAWNSERIGEEVCSLYIDIRRMDIDRWVQLVSVELWPTTCPRYISFIFSRFHFCLVAWIIYMLLPYKIISPSLSFTWNTSEPPITVICLLFDVFLVPINIYTLFFSHIWQH